MSTVTARTVSAPRWMLWTGWFFSILVVAQLLSSAWFRATHHANAVAEIVAGWGGLYLRDSCIRQLIPFRRPA